MIKYVQTGYLENSFNPGSDDVHIYTLKKKKGKIKTKQQQQQQKMKSHRKNFTFFISFPSLLLFLCPLEHISTHGVFILFSDVNWEFIHTEGN